MHRYVVGSLIGTGSVLVIAILAYLPRTNREPRTFSKSHNFGVVAPGTALQHTFKYVNTSTTTFDVVEIRTTCGCTRASAVPLEIPPGDVAQIVVDYKNPTVEGSNLQRVSVRLKGSRTTSTEVFELGCLVREEMRIFPKAAVLVKGENETNVWRGSISVSNSTKKEWGDISVATEHDWLRCESIVPVKPEGDSHARECWRVHLVGDLSDAEATQPMNDVITIRASTTDGAIEQRVAVTIPAQPASTSVAVIPVINLLPPDAAIMRENCISPNCCERGCLSRESSGGDMFV
ncbi:MAG: DUF1573 domain-containing protein [Planctomycetota bacterium]